MTAGPTLRRRTTTELLHDADAAVRRHIAARPIGQAVEVALPPLATGRHMFANLAIAQEIPPDLHWDSASYRTVTPWLVAFEDVLVHGDAGIVSAGDWVVTDTLQRTSPQAHGYTATEDGIVLAARDHVRELPGTWLSLLGGDYGSYYNWTLEGLGRLAAANASVLDQAPALLVPKLAPGLQRDGFDLSGIAEERSIRTIGAGDTVRVERMLVPWSLVGFHRPHPLLGPYFNRLSHAAAPDPGDLPARVYLDRRGLDRRPGAPSCLLNEDEIIAALAPRGFVAVRLETLSLAGQIALFAAAETIVAPHGMGLTNLVYADPGCRVIELHMDSTVNWCFRTLSAALGHHYDAVAGREMGSAPPEQGGTRLWAVPAMHMMSAVDAMLALSVG